VLLPSPEGEGRDSSWAADTFLRTSVRVWDTAQEHETRTRSCYWRSPQAIAHLSVWCQHFDRFKRESLKEKKKPNTKNPYKANQQHGLW